MHEAGSTVCKAEPVTEAPVPTNINKIIFIEGAEGMGKSTVAKQLVEHFNVLMSNQ